MANTGWLFNTFCNFRDGGITGDCVNRSDGTIPLSIHTCVFNIVISQLLEIFPVYIPIPSR